MILFHGTSAERYAKIVKSGQIRPAPLGEPHVSMTSDREVAVYFARNSNLADEAEGADLLGEIILQTDTDHLAAAGYTIKPFSSQVWGEGECDWEKEFVCLEEIPLSLFRISCSPEAEEHVSEGDELPPDIM